MSHTRILGVLGTVYVRYLVSMPTYFMYVYMYLYCQAIERYEHFQVGMVYASPGVCHAVRQVFLTPLIAWKM